MNRKIEIDSETSRIRAALVNSGHHTFDEADEKLAASGLSVVLEDEESLTPAGQAAFLTAIATGARCFGRVTVSGSLHQPLLVPLPIPATSLSEAAAFLGANESAPPSSTRTVLVGSNLTPREGWSVQAFWDGWMAGFTPGTKSVATGRSDCAIAGVAAGALAVGQAFLAEQGDVRAGRTTQSVSLWTLCTGDDAMQQPGPSWREAYLPGALWLIGLGNLGQAYLWSLALLPYSQSSDIVIFLQDDQEICRENWGTSLLTQRGRYGLLKTRVAEEWAIRRGFRVRRIDRRLDERLVRSDIEPGMALVGLDNMPARRLLGGCGFEYVIDAGLGATAKEYRKLRINVFPRAESPADHFKGVDDQTTIVAQELMQLPTYQKLALSQNDGGCGAAILAETSVAVPFVSAVAGAIAVTQAVRIVSGEAHHAAVTADLGDLMTVRATIGVRPSRIAVPNIRAVE